jgi:TfoX N-terminal domain
VAYDEALAERIRSVIEARSGVVERRMFGGVARMLNGNMACGVLGEDVLVRLGAQDGARAGRAARHAAVRDGRAPVAGVRRRRRRGRGERRRARALGRRRGRPRGRAAAEVRR